MARVKIKSPNPKDPRRKTLLLEILSRNLIYVTKIIQVQEGFLIITSSDAELDKVFNTTTSDDLNQHNFLPQIPPELKASRSIIITSVDQHIYNNNEDVIIEDLYKNNDWIKDNIDQMYKFPNSRTLKITFNRTSITKKALDMGLLLFSMRIPSYQMRQETFINILTCYKCYALEDHTTNNCPKDINYKICSECAEEGHTHKECNNTSTKKCINCDEDHRTMAMKCPKRKIIVKDKRTQHNNNIKTYSQAAKTPTTAQTTTIPINTDAHLTIFTCMLHAHFMNAAEPGCYETELNKMLKRNKLPIISAPSNPPSGRILKMGQITKQDQEQQSQTNKHNEEASNTANEVIEEVEIEEAVRQDNTNKDHSTKTHFTKGKEIGLTIHTQRSVGWPKNNLTTNLLIKGLRDQTYKMTYTKDIINEEEIIEMITKRTINIDDCFTTTEDCFFKKLRPGLIKERTPPPREQTRRKLSQ